MLPRQSLVNAVNQGFAHPEFFSKSGSTFAFSPSDFQYFLRCQFSVVRFTTSNQMRIFSESATIATGKTPFVHGIVCVVRVGAEEEMVRANTGAIIATMAHQQIAGNRPEVRFVREPMRWDVAAFAKEVPVSFVALRSRPSPALAGLVHFRPEPIKGRNLCRLQSVGSPRATIRTVSLPLQIRMKQSLTSETATRGDGRLTLHSEPRFRGVRGRSFQRRVPTSFIRTRQG